MISVAAGIQRPIDFNGELRPLCLLQTKSGNSLKVERHHAFTNGSSIDASSGVGSTTSVNVPLLSQKGMASSEHLSARKSTAALQELSSDTLDVSENSVLPSTRREPQQFVDDAAPLEYETSKDIILADAQIAESVLGSFNKVHGTLSDELPLFDSTAAQPSASSTQRSLLIAHVILTVVVVIAVMITAMVSICNARTEKVDDARSILEHISKAAVPPQPLYGATATETQPLYSEPFEPLCVVPEVQAEGSSYLLPDLAQMKDGVVPFDIVNSCAETILEGVINNEAKDAGILLQQPNTDDGIGAPVAFVSTSRAALAFGNIPIVRPRVDCPQGDHFGILKRIANDKYSVVRKNRTVMVIEGHIAERCLRIHSALADSTKGSHDAIGSTRPCADANGQARIELHAGSGVDSGLAIICLLTIIRLEAARSATT
jgi:hypothetical protein